MSGFGHSSVPPSSSVDHQSVWNSQFAMGRNVMENNSVQNRLYLDKSKRMADENGIFSMAQQNIRGPPQTGFQTSGSLAPSQNTSGDILSKSSALSTSSSSTNNFMHSSNSNLLNNPNAFYQNPREMTLLNDTMNKQGFNASPRISNSGLNYLVGGSAHTPSQDVGFLNSANNSVVASNHRYNTMFNGAPGSTKPRNYPMDMSHSDQQPMSTHIDNLEYPVLNRLKPSSSAIIRPSNQNVGSINLSPQQQYLNYQAMLKTPMDSLLNSQNAAQQASSQEFSIQQEDFPALPVAQNPNTTSSSSSTPPATSNTSAAPSTLELAAAAQQQRISIASTHSIPTIPSSSSTSLNHHNFQQHQQQQIHHHSPFNSSSILGSNPNSNSNIIQSSIGHSQMSNNINISSSSSLTSMNNPPDSLATTRSFAHTVTRNTSINANLDSYSSIGGGGHTDLSNHKFNSNVLQSNYPPHNNFIASNHHLHLQQQAQHQSIPGNLSISQFPNATSLSNSQAALIQHQHQQKKVIQIANKNMIANIPNEMVQDAFGLMGLIKLINVNSSYENLKSLAPGFDMVTDLNKDLISTKDIYTSFAAPLSSKPNGRAHDMDFPVPKEYRIRHMILDRLAEPTPEGLGDPTLFWIFYNLCGEESQLVAAKQLHARNWRYHRIERVWFQREPKSEQPMSNSNFERSTFIVWDYEKWQRTTRVFTLYFKDIETMQGFANILSSKVNFPFCYNYPFVKRNNPTGIPINSGVNSGTHLRNIIGQPQTAIGAPNPTNSLINTAQLIQHPQAALPVHPPGPNPPSLYQTQPPPPTTSSVNTSSNSSNQPPQNSSSNSTSSTLNPTSTSNNNSNSTNN